MKLTELNEADLLALNAQLQADRDALRAQQKQIAGALNLHAKRREIERLNLAADQRAQVLGALGIPSAEAVGVPGLTPEMIVWTQG